MINERIHVSWNFHAHGQVLKKLAGQEKSETSPKYKFEAAWASFVVVLLCKSFYNIENYFSFQVKKEAKVQFMATEVHGKFACKRSWDRRG